MPESCARELQKASRIGSMCALITNACHTGVQMIDLISLKPFDMAAITASVRRPRRVIIMECISEPVANQVS